MLSTKNKHANWKFFKISCSKKQHAFLPFITPKTACYSPILQKFGLKWASPSGSIHIVCSIYSTIQIYSQNKTINLTVKLPPPSLADHPPLLSQTKSIHVCMSSTISKCYHHSLSQLPIVSIAIVHARPLLLSTQLLPF